MQKRANVVATEPDFELMIAVQRASWQRYVSVSMTIAALALATLVVEWRLFAWSAVPLAVSALLGSIATLVACSEMVDRAERCRGLHAMREAWHAAAPGPTGDATRRCLSSLMRSIYGAEACAPKPARVAYEPLARAPELQRAA